MRSSISNSDINLTHRDTPQGRWFLPFVVSIGLLIFVVTGMEWTLARRGFKPTVVDSAERWGKERDRARSLGQRALILVGASRAQLDIDLAALGRDTGKTPVQLAIDGSSFVPVLADLAADEQVTGTVLVDYQDANLVWRDHEAPALSYVGHWMEASRHSTSFGFASSESALAAIRQRFMRSYADGAGPFAALAHRVLAPRAVPQYLVTLSSREREANYSLVPMPAFYFSRVMRNAGLREQPIGNDPAAFEAMLETRIKALPRAPLTDFEDNARAVGRMVSRIEARGGSVVFVMYPKTGLVKEADEIRFPRGLFWNRLLPLAGHKGLYFSDVPALAAFQCPDGSHLDVRDRLPFTHALAAALLTRGWVGERHHDDVSHP